MTTIKCQHSQIEFEAKSKNTRQHPLVATFKTEESKRGDYRLACAALEKAAKIGGYETIEQYMEIVNDIYTGQYEAKLQAQRADAAEENARSYARREARTKREATNRHLREHGYGWSKEYTDPAYAAGWGEDDSEVWVLRSPDGREVSVNQALDEIERGADLVLAEIEATEEAEMEVKQATEEWETAKNEIKTGMTEVEVFDYSGWQTTFNRSSHETITTG